MSDHWNDLNLPIPSLSNYEMSRKKFDIDKFKKLIEDAINYFSHLDDLNSEIEQISRFIYIGREQFRMLRGFQEMKKTQQAASRFQRLDMLGILEAFNSYIFDDFKTIRLPHRQNLDYILIKLQGLAKLLVRLVTCARKSSKFFLGLICAGSFYIKGSVFVASLGRIWDISRSICKFSVNLYNNLIIYRDQLEFDENIEWVANNCELPNKLDEWLGCEYDKFIINESYDIKMLTSEEEIEKLLENRGKNIFGNIKEETELKSPDTLDKITTNILDIKIESDELEDYTPIARSAVKKEEEYIHSLSAIKSKEHVKKFITTEDRLRKVNAEHSLTIKKVKKKVWKDFKNDLRTKISLMQESSLVEYFHDHLNEFLE